MTDYLYWTNRLLQCRFFSRTKFEQHGTINVYGVGSLIGGMMEAFGQRFLQRGAKKVAFFNFKLWLIVNNFHFMRVLTPWFDAAIFCRGFLSRHSGRIKRKRDYSSLHVYGSNCCMYIVHVSSREMTEGLTLLGFITVTTPVMSNNVTSTIFPRFLRPFINFW